MPRPQTATVRHMTWNQGDRGDSPNDGWDIGCITERSKHAPPARMERYTARLIKGLAIDYDPDVLDVRRRRSVLAHLGAPRFSPARGTLWVTGRLVENGCKVAVVCSHRINDPDGDKRAHGPVRRLLWNTHARLDRELFKRLEKSGYLVLYGGDVNHRTNPLAPLVRVVKGRYDALAHSNSDVIRLARVTTDRSGVSDHARFTATYEITQENP